MSGGTAAEALRALAILVVDDEPRNVDVLGRLLAREGYARVRTCTDPEEALRLFDVEPPDLVLLDLHMPGMNGFELMGAIRGRLPSHAYLPILVLTGDPESDTRQRALSAGATDFVTKPFETIEVLLRIRNLLETRHLHIRLQQHAEELEEKVRLRTQELEEAQSEILARLARAAEYRDDVTGQHAQRVGDLTAMLARELGLEEPTAELLRRAAPLHDVGKIGIPDAILLKQGGLTAPEFDLMRTHVDIGARILGGSNFELLRVAREIALSHHERWDGGGYQGIGGAEIPLSGRIVAVADVVDCLAHDRPYKSARPFPEVVEVIVSERGRHFDPDVVDAFMRLVEAGALAGFGVEAREARPPAAAPDAKDAKVEPRSPPS